AANAKEKIDEGIDALIQQIGDQPGAFTDDLRNAGIDPNNLYLLAEDSGLHLEDERILEHMDLEKLGLKPGYVFNAKHFPGVEFGPAINSALGESAFWDEVNRVNREEIKESPARPEAHSTSVLALRKIALNPEYRMGGEGKPLNVDEEIKFYSAMTNDTIADKPYPPTTVPTSFHYQIPVSQGVAEHKTRAQMSWDEWFKYSPRGEAARTLMQATGMLENGKLKNEFTAQRIPPIRKQAELPYRIGVFGHDEKDATKIKGSISTSLPLKDLGATNDWNDKITDLAGNADAFVLMPRDHNTPAKDDPQFFDQLFTFFSAIVARQIHPRDIDKPFIVYNHKNCWGDLLELYDHMRNNAMVFDQSRLLLSEVSSMKELQDELQKGQRNNFISTHEEREQGPMTINESGRFNVAVFCSATARNETLNNDAKQLGTFLGENNYGLVYGAGDREMMGSVYDGMREVRNTSDGKKGWISASSSDHILEVEADHPEIFKKPLSKDNPNGVNQYYDAANIYERIEYMVKTSDAFAVIPGGAGTVQELAAILMMKEAGHPSMKGKHIVVMSKMNIGGQDVDFYGPLLKHIPKERLEALDVHVVDSMQQVEEKLNEARNSAMQGQPTSTITEVGKYYKHEGHINMPHELH
ncbi:MAG: LOG family protein, partial [Rickettsiales bacterium]|nr:LOG family protein [Rickettsiales bacterium]